MMNTTAAVLFIFMLLGAWVVGVPENRDVHVFNSKSGFGGNDGYERESGDSSVSYERGNSGKCGSSGSDLSQAGNRDMSYPYGRRSIYNGAGGIKYFTKISPTVSV